MRPSMKLCLFGIGAHWLGYGSSFVHGCWSLAYGVAAGLVIGLAAGWLADRIRVKHTSIINVAMTQPVSAAAIAGEIERAMARAKL